MGVICHEPRLFPAVMIAGVVTSDDAAHLPPAEFTQELLAWKSYLAHEQLIEFMGGGQFFFLSSSLSSDLSSGSTAGLPKKSLTSVMTTVNAVMMSFNT